MHAEARAWIERAVRGRRWGQVIEFGSLDINGSVRELIDCENYTGIDLVEGPGVDIVMDAVDFDAEERADLLVCCEVLEHAPDAEGLIWSAWSNLKPGGTFLVTCATDYREPHSAIDGGNLRPGEHYENIRAGWLVSVCDNVGFTSLAHLCFTGRGDLYLRAVRRGS